MRKMFSENQIKAMAGADPEKIIEIVNEGIESGKIETGGDLYIHKVVLRFSINVDGSSHLHYLINYFITKDETPFTKQTFAKYLYDLGYNTGDSISRGVCPTALPTQDYLNGGIAINGFLTATSATACTGGIYYYSIVDGNFVSVYRELTSKIYNSSNANLTDVVNKIQ